MHVTEHALRGFIISLRKGAAAAESSPAVRDEVAHIAKSPRAESWQSKLDDVPVLLGLLPKLGGPPIFTPRVLRAANLVVLCHKHAPTREALAAMGKLEGSAPPASKATPRPRKATSPASKTTRRAKKTAPAAKKTARRKTPWRRSGPSPSTAPAH